MLGLAGLYEAFASNNYSGAIVALDNFPPFVIAYSFLPENWSEKSSAKFQYVGQPGGRFRHPIYTGNTEHTLSFELFFDDEYIQGVPGYAAGAYSQAAFINKISDNMIAKLRTLKLPRMASTKTLLGITGTIMKAETPDNDPSPPLCLVSKGWEYYYLGYFEDVDIKELRYNENSVPIRISASCKFVVAPDMVFTTLDDALRLAKVIVGV